MLFTSFQADHSRTKAFARQILRATVARPSLSNFALGPNVCRRCPVHARRFSTTALLSPSYARKQWKPDCSITSTRRVSPSRTACVRENEELTDSPCAEVIASALTLSCRAAFLCSLFILVFSIPDILALRFVRILRRGKS